MQYTKSQSAALILLRLAVGWHFLYEGGVKLLNPSWTSKAYLLDSGGFLKGFFHHIASHSGLLAISDYANAWGLTLIGLSLIIGLLTRYAAISGIFLLLLYYLSHPAIPGMEYMFPSDGSYFIVNKTLVEMFSLLVLLVFPTSRIFGVERLLCKPKNQTL